MKATGIVRKLDGLGRVVLPVELRRQLDVGINDQLNISVNGNELILTKYVPKCVFCRSDKDVVKKMEQYVCRKCISEIQ